MHLNMLTVLFVGFAVFVLTASANQPQVGLRKQNMEATMTTVSVVLVLRVYGEQVETDHSGPLKCADVDTLRDLSFYSSRGLPVTVGFDEASRRITVVSSAPTDLLVALSPRETSEQQVTVQLMMRPSLLYLSKSHLRFEYLYEQLWRALAEKRRVVLGVLPGSNLIEDVRIE